LSPHATIEPSFWPHAAAPARAPATSAANIHGFTRVMVVVLSYPSRARLPFTSRSAVRGQEAVAPYTRRLVKRGSFSSELSLSSKCLNRLAFPLVAGVSPGRSCRGVEASTAAAADPLLCPRRGGDAIKKPGGPDAGRMPAPPLPALRFGMAPHGTP
jgi:hypothetical protein